MCQPATFTGLFQVLPPLCADSTIHLAAVIIITAGAKRQRQGGRWEDKYSLSINMSSEFLT